MNIITFTNKISPLKFNHWALIISLSWLVLIYPALHWLCRDKLPESYRLGGSDFGQYYSGALVARHGLWDQLYPIPKNIVYEKNIDFQPEFKIPFLRSDTQNIKENWSYYGSVASPANSDISQSITNFCPRLQNDWRYIYPPPLAVLLWPLGFFDYKTASNIWFMFMTTSLFGIGYFASLIYRELTHKITHLEGCIMLSPVIVTMLASNASTALNPGNSTPLLGFFISLVSYAWITNRQVAIAFGMIPLLLFKGIGLSWCPLLLIKPIKWKTIITLSLLTLIINGITVSYGGLLPYKTFFSEIIPKANVPLGYGLQWRLLYMFGLDTKWFFTTLSLLLFAIIYWGYLRRFLLRDTPPHSNELTIASISGLMSIFFLCNPVVWPHYYMTYIFLPFSGWILWERTQARGLRKRLIDCVISVSIIFWMDELFLTKASFIVRLLKRLGLYNNILEQMRGAFCFFTYHVAPTFIAVFLIFLTIRRLFLGQTPLSTGPSS